MEYEFNDTDSENEDISEENPAPELTNQGE
jgi:hypothetical protein